ncbi:MAG TPA: RDD family protein [Burkholderiaceae bacterium]|nr:RDD family protein [Burkholderiaceae bacterium]
MTGGVQPFVAPLPAPSVRRRLACMLYEAVLLFGVVMVAGLAYGMATDQRNALQGNTGLQAFLFLVLGAYFAGLWSSSGQTLAMKTWHIRVLAADGRPPGWPRAAARYVASWLWFLPALASAHAAGIRSVGFMTSMLLAGIAAYAVLARLRNDRQLLHDVLCGTRLVDTRATMSPPAQWGHDAPA